MPRPRGRRKVYRKFTFFPSELARILPLCPQGETEILRVSLLCRSIALGERVVSEPVSYQAQEPPELTRARGDRAEGQLGRTPCCRTQRDILFFDAEWDAFEARIPRNVKFQAFLRGLATGRFAVSEDEKGRRTQRWREQFRKCGLCGNAREDQGEYCQSCRGVEDEAAA